MDLAELVSRIPEIERALRSSFREAGRRDPARFRPYVDLLEEFVLRGGKRFRALMVLAGYHIATRRDPRPAYPAAAAMEHFQGWMLIHDDIIDHSEVRRGGPTVHRELEARHRAAGRLGDGASEGVGLGITLGDLEEPFTVEALLRCRLPPGRLLRALSEYVRMTRLTAYGQVLDIVNGNRPIGDLREADVLLVHELKSAIYTVAAPLRIGATLGGAPEGLIDELGRFGIDIGIAFQLRDDILGTGLGTQATGKSANDLSEGKRTLLAVKAWQEADETGRAELSAALGNPQATPELLRGAQAVIRRSGSLAYSEARIARLSERAYRRLRSSRRLSRAQRALLEEIGERLVHRSI